MAVPLLTVVSVLSLDYGAFLASVDQPPQPDEVGAIILAKAAADRYEAEREGACALYEFEQIGATYWFDFASSAALAHEDRTSGLGGNSDGDPPSRFQLSAWLSNDS